MVSPSKRRNSSTVGFRITDQQDRASRAYLIVPHGGMVTVTSGDGFDLRGQPKRPENVSEKVDIKRRDDLTIENVKKLISGAIAEYRNDRKRTQQADYNDDPK
jgi:hypothetical protein